MSSVELPLVISARSSTSSASSNRSHLNSAGSVNSQMSSRSVRIQHSQYQQQEDDEDVDDDACYGNDDQVEVGTAQKDEEPQESGGLWNEVEHFLNKPSPSLSNLAGKTTKATANKPPKSVLPTLRKSSPDNQNLHPSRPARAVVASSAGSKTIDPKLLQEAFAYAHQLQQMDFDEDGDEEEQQQSWKSNKTKMLMQRAALGRTHSSSSASSLASNSVPSGPRGSRAGGGKAPSSVSSDARKKKGRMASSSVYSSAAKPKAFMKKNRSSPEEPQGIDAKTKGQMEPQTLQALVSNFQHGTQLEELRKELLASQQSMALSRQVLHDAAHNFFQSH